MKLHVFVGALFLGSIYSSVILAAEPLFTRISKRQITDSNSELVDSDRNRYERCDFFEDHVEITNSYSNSSLVIKEVKPFKMEGRYSLQETVDLSKLESLRFPPNGNNCAKNSYTEISFKFSEIPGQDPIKNIVSLNCPVSHIERVGRNSDILWRLSNLFCTHDFVITSDNG